MKSFVHLHKHSEYSLLDGCGTAAQYAGLAAELEQPAMALTDHGSLSGVLDHMKSCRDVGIVPINGVEAYFRPHRQPHDKTNHEYWHMVLLAKDLRGWRSLVRLTSEAYQSGFYRKACVDRDLIERHHEGLIASTACFSSYLCRSITAGDEEAADEHLAWMKSVFGDDLFVEIMPHDMDEQRALNVELANVATKHGLPLVATCDAHYPYEEWADTQDIAMMMGMRTSFKKREKKREEGKKTYEFHSKSMYLMSRDEVGSCFERDHPDLPRAMVEQAMDNTLEISDRCGMGIIFDRSNKLPRISRTPEEAEQTVRTWAMESFRTIRERWRGDEDGGVARERRYLDQLEHELGVLRDNQVLDYFVIVGRFIRWAKSQGIPIGPGRGSAAGSLVTYLIGITGVDPIAHGLIFERFLNPHRKGLPDIDIDIDSEYRAVVSDYARQQLGKDNVVDLISYQTLQARSAVKRVSTVFDLSAGMVTEVTKSIPDFVGEDPPLEELRVGNQKLERFAEDYPTVWRHACRLQGSVSAISEHPAGVVVSDKPLVMMIPTMKTPQGEEGGVTVTAWGESAGASQKGIAISDLGLLKIDFLSLKNLTKQRYACDLIRQNTGEIVDLDSLSFLHDPYDIDDDILEGFRRGLTVGIFQFANSSGIKNLVKQISPTWFGDIVAVNAMYRPGPIDVADEYVELKHGRSEVEYWHESVGDVLAETYGLMIYQEQVMAIAQRLGQFSMARADTFRKTMSKYYRLGAVEAKKMMAGDWDDFLAGCLDQGLLQVVAEDVWAKTLNMGGGYSFNKCAHARTMVTLPDGSQMKLSKAYRERPLEIMSMWPDGEVRPHRVRRIVSTGKKPVYKVATQSGLVFRGTLEHRLLSTSGYTEIGHLAVGDELVVQARPCSDAQRVARRETMTRLAGRPERVDQDRRTSERMKAYQASRPLEDKVAHMKRVHAEHPEIVQALVGHVGEAARERLGWLHANNPEWRRSFMERSLASVRAAYDTGPGYGHCSIASDGTWCASAREREMCEFLIDRSVEFEAHKVLPNGRVCDFYFDGVYWEMDGMDRVVEYFEEKYGDLPFVVVTPEDFQLKVARHLELEHVENGDPIILIEYAGQLPTYDVEMEDDGPKNWMAGRIVSHNSHAVCYAALACMDMWLKRKFPLQFYAAQLSYLPNGGTEKVKRINQIMREARAQDIPVLPPSVNASAKGFMVDVEAGALRFGLLAIKHVGDVAVKNILANRPYWSYDDFKSRSGCNAQVIRALADVGGLDIFGARDEVSTEEKVDRERALLGIPLSSFLALREQREFIEPRVDSPEEIERMPQGEGVTVGGEVVTPWKEHTIKGSGDTMAFVEFVLGMSEWEGVFFPRQYARSRAALSSGRPVMAKGYKNERDGITIDEVVLVDDLVSEHEGVAA